MKTIIYAEDFEPITVINMSRQLLRLLGKIQQVRVPVMTPIHLPLPYSAKVLYEPPKVVTVNCIWVKNPRNGVEAPILYTADEESALLLEAEILPGQQRVLNAEFERGFVNGFASALEKLL